MIRRCLLLGALQLLGWPVFSASEKISVLQLDDSEAVLAPFGDASHFAGNATKKSATATQAESAKNGKQQNADAASHGAEGYPERWFSQGGATGNWLVRNGFSPLNLSSVETQFGDNALDGQMQAENISLSDLYRELGGVLARNLRPEIYHGLLQTYDTVAEADSWVRSGFDELGFKSRPVIPRNRKGVLDLDDRLYLGISLNLDGDIVDAENSEHQTKSGGRPGAAEPADDNEADQTQLQLQSMQAAQKQHWWFIKYLIFMNLLYAVLAVVAVSFTVTVFKTIIKIR